MSQDQDGAAAPRIQPIWDAPTRALKWSLAITVAAAWGYGETMGFETIGTHIWLGYAVGALLICRLIWGFVGAPASRLSTLVKDAVRAPAYARGVLKPQPSYWPGHNPMGSLWLLALIASLAVQVGTGLMSYSDSFYEGGPLHELVGDRWSAWANGVHEVNSGVLLGLIALHLSAVFFYAIWKMEDLIGPMLTGSKPVRPRPGEESEPAE